MKISIITVTYNSELYLEQTILSVINQTYKNYEFIIIDGGSTDNTISIIEKYKQYVTFWISENDKGIYDAMNKGITFASGDIIGFLNSDDIYYDNNILEIISSSFNDNIESIFGDIVYVNNKDTNVLNRHYSSKNFKLKHFSYGHMPPHPSFYALKKVYDKIGFFKDDYKIAADFDYLVRVLLINKIKFKYMNIIFVRMRSGGISSTYKNKIKLNSEIYRSCRENKIETNYLKIYSKYFYKVFSFFFK